jgi:hypothetical protein
MTTPHGVVMRLNKVIARVGVCGFDLPLDGKLVPGLGDFEELRALLAVAHLLRESAALLSVLAVLAGSLHGPPAPVPLGCIESKQKARPTGSARATCSRGSKSRFVETPLRDTPQPQRRLGGNG